MKKYRFCLFALLLLPLQGTCWGKAGHEIVLDIAYHFMKPSARAQFDRILVGMTRAQAGTWLDEQRLRTRFYQSWHFIAFPVGNDEEVLDEANVVTMLNRTVFKLQHRKAGDTSGVRTDLLILVHLIGDLHQPVHISDQEDKGANMVRVNVDGRSTNLHAVWDNYLFQHGEITTADCLSRYRAAEPAFQVKGIAVLTWASECRQIFKKEVYSYDKARFPELTKPYLQHSEEIVRRQLLLAGLRLAFIMDHLFT